ncbi:MAG: YihY/virulence factor BrkB family protein [Paracoccaceae bacterium]
MDGDPTHGTRRVIARARTVRDAAVRSPVSQFVWAVIDGFNRNQGSVLAGYLAFAGMLALLPFLVFASALTGFLIGPENSTAVLDTLFAAVPDHVAKTLEPVILEVIGARRSGVLTISALASIWAASSGIEALRVGLDQAYRVGDTRHLALNRLVAVVVVLVGYLIFAALSILVIAAPLAFHIIEELTGVMVPALADWLRYGMALAILWIALWLLHRLLPARAMGGFVLWPGVLASVVLWVAMATGMSAYLAYAPEYTITYGTLAGVILTLLFFYLTGMVILLGAELNAVVNAERIAAATQTDAAGLPRSQISQGFEEEEAGRWP